MVTSEAKEETVKTIHSLCGTAALLKAMRFAELLGELENAMIKADEQKIGSLSNQVLTAAKAIVEQLAVLEERQRVSLGS